jgi:hypothetical protein
MKVCESLDFYASLHKNCSTICARMGHQYNHGLELESTLLGELLTQRIMLIHKAVRAGTTQEC